MVNYSELNKLHNGSSRAYYLENMVVINKIKEHRFKVKKEKDTFVFLSDQEEAYYKGLINEIPDKTEFWLAIKEKRPSRTLAQNNYYWLYMDGLANETGYTPEEMHEYCKAKFLEYKTLRIREMYILVSPSTTDLTVKEFMEYIKRIEVDTGIPAPDTRLCGLYEHILKSGMLN